MKLHITLALSLCAVLSSCVSFEADDGFEFSEKIAVPGQVQLTGWMLVHGEVLIYSDLQHLRRRSKSPYCISGVFENHDPSKIAKFDGQKVLIVGSLFNFNSLLAEESPVIPRKILGGSVIPNFCHGERVVLIDSIKLAP